MNINNLKEVLADQPKFRIKQALKAVFTDHISNWNDSTTLPLSLREKLNEACPLGIDAEIFGSKTSSSLKALITLQDGKKVETVLMRHKDGRMSVCVSSQIGCPLGCSFCATGKMGYIRNLEASEIVEQILFWQRYLNKNSDDSSRVTNIVYMGMGEPFLNYDNVMESIKTINDKNGFNLGSRHISISTSGLVDGINKFSKENLQVNLAISLHAPNNRLRYELMPINKKYSIEELMSSVENYVDNKSRRVMFEYLMIDGVNDKEVHARELAKIMKHPLYMVNLIKYNETGKYKSSSQRAIDKFKNVLLRSGVKVTQRHSFGGDIAAACGQLAGKIN